MHLESQHEGGNWVTFWFEALCIFGSLTLILVHSWSIWQQRDFWSPWLLLAIVMAWPAADFVSGLVHWTADTWGSEEFPILGPRFIRPFRVHHTSPTSFLKCNFLDTNGDTCLISIPVLLCFYWIPIHATAGLFAMTFGVAFCIFAIPTNQIHQWAHMRRPPAMDSVPPKNRVDPYQRRTRTPSQVALLRPLLHHQRILQSMA